jgi:hypothetical protein
MVDLVESPKIQLACAQRAEREPQVPRRKPGIVTSHGLAVCQSHLKRQLARPVIVPPPA